MVRRYVVGIVFLVIYIVAVIPLAPYLLSIVVDFVNSSNFLEFTYNTVQYKYNSTCDCFQPEASIVRIDLRPVVIFLAQFIVYFVIPVLGVLGILRR